MNTRDPVRPADANPLPATIGRYRIVERIGKGAMGVVYRAHDDQLGRTVAVKVLMTDFAEEPDVRARFYREAQSAGRLLHRNIITIFDLGDDRGRAYIVMELLAGSTLSEYMARPEAADLEARLDLMVQVCDGLGAAHAAGIIHRDIKPGNLFVLNDGGLKILDFGVARLVTSSMTVRGHIIGTPSYMSPEQATGRQIDHRSDIFSVGGVFYWMLCGRKPFAAPDLPSVLRKVQFEDPPALREEDAPAPLARIVFRALAKDPAHRYQRITDMLGDLQRFKRQYEADSLRMGGLAQGHVQAIRSLEAEMTGLRARLGGPVPERPDPLAPLLARYPPLAERGLSSLGVLAFRRAVTAGILRDVERIGSLVEAEAAELRGAIRAAEAEAERRASAAGQELANRVAEAIGAARELFADRRRPEAIESLEDFLAEHPTCSAVQTEIERLRQEAERLAPLEQRQMEIDARWAGAVAASAGDLEGAIQAVSRVLELDGAHQGALRLLAELRARRRADAEATTRLAGVAGLLGRARLALDRGALRHAVNACRRVDALDPGNADAAAIKAEAARRAGRVREALERARQARRVERAVGLRLASARVSLRLGRFRQAYDAATEALASMPGSPHAAAIRDAAAAAVGMGSAVGTAGGESWAAGEETVGTDTTVTGHAPD